MKQMHGSTKNNAAVESLASHKEPDPRPWRLARQGDDTKNAATHGSRDEVFKVRDTSDRKHEIITATTKNQTQKTTGSIKQYKHNMR